MEIAFDLGAHIGWCVRKDTGVFVSGHRKLTRSSDNDKYQKITRFQSFVNNKLESFDITQIYYEKVTFSTTTYATQAHGAYKGILHSIAKDNDIPIQGFNVKHVKKSLTGRGNASKHGMVKYATDYVDYPVNDDNEADAIGVMNAGRGGRI